MSPHRPRRRRQPHQRRRRAQAPVASAALAALAVTCLGAATGCGAAHHQAYGGLPAFLPKVTVPVDRIVTASAAHPQLAVQGVAVDARLPAGQVQADVTGPAVPPFVAPPPPAVTTTFTVSMRDISGTVPVRVGDFTIRDQTGRLVAPLLVQGESPPPPAAPDGGTLRFQLTAVLPVGEGTLRWAPGGQPTVTWDFVVEND